MKHFLNLEKCSCGAYRYLAVREHKRSYEVYLIHHAHLQNAPDSRKYSKLASIPKYTLNIHDPRNAQSSQARSVTLTYEQERLVRSIFGQLVRGSPVREMDNDIEFENELEQVERIDPLTA